MGSSFLIRARQQIENILLAEDLSTYHAERESIGKAYRIDDARGRYIVYLKRSFPDEYSLEGMKIVLDCANGATYRIAPEVFFELGAKVLPLVPRTGRQEHQQGMRITAP